MTPQKIRKRVGIRPPKRVKSPSYLKQLSRQSNGSEDIFTIKQFDAFMETCKSWWCRPLNSPLDI